MMALYYSRNFFFAYPVYKKDQFQWSDFEGSVRYDREYIYCRYSSRLIARPNFAYNVTLSSFISVSHAPADMDRVDIRDPKSF